MYNEDTVGRIMPIQYNYLQQTSWWSKNSN